MRILKGMKELLADESKWTQKVFARNAEGREILPENEDAVAFCLLGAKRRVTESLLKQDRGDVSNLFNEEDHDIDLLQKCVESMTGPYFTIPMFNDLSDTDFPRVMAALDCAIAKCEAEETNA